jgi:predicted DNA-binding transcriptional regulator AlpA
MPESQRLTNPSCNVLRLPEVLRRIPVSRATLLRSLDRGDFPSPIVIGKRCRGWIEADLIAWLDQRRQNGEGMGVSLSG